MSLEDHHFCREDRASHWQRIASQIEHHPEDLAIPLANIERWLTLGRVHPAPLKEWRNLILAAQASPDEFRNFICFLAAPDFDGQLLKSCSPFVGLPRREIAEQGV